MPDIPGGLEVATPEYDVPGYLGSRIPDILPGYSKSLIPNTSGVPEFFRRVYSGYPDGT